jgi:hypothetical protein
MPVDRASGGSDCPVAQRDVKDDSAGCETMPRVGTERERARVLHGQLVELLEAARSGELPVGPAFRHRLEGGITALEAVLGLPPSLGEDVFTPSEHKVL